MHSRTLETFYDTHALQYFDETVGVDMTEYYNRFLKYIPLPARIIDIGAGSGRDIKYFKGKGYEVEGIDASVELCKIATEYTGIEVLCQRVQDWIPTKKYDGIWANASLVHLYKKHFEELVLRIDRVFTKEGVFFFSLKSGIKTGFDERGRYFTNYLEQDVIKVIEEQKT